MGTWTHDSGGRMPWACASAAPLPSTDKASARSKCMAPRPLDDTVLDPAGKFHGLRAAASPTSLPRAVKNPEIGPILGDLGSSTLPGFVPGLRSAASSLGAAFRGNLVPWQFHPSAISSLGDLIPRQPHRSAISSLWNLFPRQSCQLANSSLGKVIICQSSPLAIPSLRCSLP